MSSSDSGLLFCYKKSKEEETEEEEKENVSAALHGLYSSQ